MVLEWCQYGSGYLSPAARQALAVAVHCILSVFTPNYYHTQFILTTHLHITHFILTPCLHHTHFMLAANLHHTHNYCSGGMLPAARQAPAVAVHCPYTAQAPKNVESMV
jgi:hypothetical protein